MFLFDQRILKALENPNQASTFPLGMLIWEFSGFPALQANLFLLYFAPSGHWNVPPVKKQKGDSKDNAVEGYSKGDWKKGEEAGFTGK